MKKQQKTIKRKTNLFEPSLVSIITVGLIASLVLTLVTHIHEIAVYASMSCAILGIAVFCGRYISGNSYRARTSDRSTSGLSPFHAFLILISIGMFFMFVPVYDTLQGQDATKTLFLSIHNTVRLFVVDADFSIIQEYLASDYAIDGSLASIFEHYAVVLFVVAPVMTAGFVLSFVKDAWSHILSLINCSRTVIYMSELNPQSISLARDIRASKEYRKSMIVFFDVFDEEGEEYHELISRAHHLGAICFRKDISSVRIRPVFLFKKKKLKKFFFIGVNEEENIKQAINLIDRSRTELHPSSSAEFYVFSIASDSEALLDAVNKERPFAKDQKSFKVRRIDVTKNLAINTVRDYCDILPAGERISAEAILARKTKKPLVKSRAIKYKLFARARALKLSKKKAQRIKIRAICQREKLYPSAHNAIKQYTLSRIDKVVPKLKDVKILIVGAGIFGTELLKTLCWSAQLPGCNPIIHIVDKEENTEKRFKAEFPELLEYSEKFKDGDTRYTIKIHSGIDVTGSDFEDKINEIGGVDIAFAALGDDELNVKVAMDMRRWFGRMENNGGAPVPRICAVVYSTRKTETFNRSGGLKCQGGQEYGINLIGDIKSVYSLRNVENSALEKEAEPYHMFWATNGLAEKKMWLRRYQNANPQKTFEKARVQASEAIDRTFSMLDNEDVKRALSKKEKIKNDICQAISDKENQATDFDALGAKINAIIDEALDGVKLTKYGTHLFENAKVWLKEITDRIFTEKRLEKARAELESARAQIETDKQNYSHYEYYRRSSISRAVHNQILKRLAYNVIGDEKKKIEHIRWNAFMRAEGYVYTEKKPKAKNVDKLHQDLRPYEKLSRVDKSKDF